MQFVDGCHPTDRSTILSPPRKRIIAHNGAWVRFVQVLCRQRSVPPTTRVPPDFGRLDRTVECSGKCQLRSHSICQRPELAEFIEI
jgi:hypothetical protein